MRTLGLLYLWFAAVTLALGAILDGGRNPLLAVCLTVSSALCLWAAIEKSPRAVVALSILPWILGIGMYTLASTSDRRDVLLIIGTSGLLWSGICVAVALRMRKLRTPAP
jgi:hypothetical protein